MQVKLGRWSRLAIIVVCSVLASIVSTGKLSKHSFVGHDLQGISKGDITHDGWVGEELRIAISNFAGIGNRVALYFGHIRPGANEVPFVAISVCDRPWKEFEIGGTAPIKLALPFGCSPLHLKIKSLRFFQPATESKPRLLGTHLASVSVNSWIGLPLVDWWLIAVVAGFFVGLGFFTRYVAQKSGMSILVALGVVGALAGGLVFLSDVAPSKFPPVMVLSLGMLVGMWGYLQRRAQEGEEPKIVSMFLFLIAVVVATSLRLYGITFGLPANFHPDEVPKVNAIMRMVDQNTLDPQYFLHPSLLLYSSYGVNVVLHWLGVEGSFRETAFLAGRLVSATAGIGSVVLVYLIGARLYSRMVGAVGALLLATFPLHVTCSRYMKEDALLTFVVLMCLWTTLVAVQTNKRWLLLVAGLLAGASAGVKYSGLLMVGIPATAPWISSRSIKPDKRWLGIAIFSVCVAPLGFIATTPFSVLNSAKFLKDFHSESRHMQTGHTVTISAWSQLWCYHLWRSIRPGITLPITVVGCVALGFLIRRSRLEDLILVGMALLFYLPAEFVKAKPAPQPERYILPCLPFIAMGIGVVCDQLRRDKTALLRRGTVLLVIALVSFPFARSVLLARDVPNDTREQLATWMIQNLPHDSKVLMDWKPYCPNFHGKFFNVEHIPRARIIQDLSVNRLRNSGAQYLVLSSLFYDRYFSQPESAAILRQRFREIFSEVPIVRQFEATAGTYGFHNPTLTLFSLDGVDFKRLDAQREVSGDTYQEAIGDKTLAVLGW
jgi:4-amino-4-deoxy-L-arabinose transferase-like glycosyltransferase